MKIRVSALALACALAYPFVALAQAKDAQLGTVVVSATRQPVKVNALLADVTVIDRAEIERAAASNMLDLLARQPGIQLSRNGGPGAAVNLYVRGTKPDQTKILVDGIPYNSTSLGGSSLQYLSLNNVERIEIVRGAASAIYGADAIGGVINVITRRGEQGLALDAFAGLGTDQTRQADVGVSGGNEQWRFRLHANSLKTDGFSAIKNAINQDADDDPYRNEGYAGSLSFFPADGHEVGASFLEQSGSAHYDSSAGTGRFKDRASFSTSVFNVFSKNRLTDVWNSALSYGRTDEDRSDYSQPQPWNPRGVTRRESTNEIFSWQNDLALSLGKALIVLERFEQEAGPRTSFSRGNLSINSVGLGWTADVQAHSWQANLRHDDHSQYGNKTTGGVAYGYQFADTWRATAGLSKAFRSPTLDELYNPSYGNSNLKPENALNRELGLAWGSGAQIASATYFVNSIEDLIGWSGVYKNVNKAKIKGLTLAYGLALEGWDVSVSADLLDPVDESTNKQLGRRAKRSATLAANKDLGAWNVGGEWVAVGRRYNTNNETEALGGYGLLNLTARYAIDRNWAIEARADNVFDKDYETARTFGGARGYGTGGAMVFVGLRYSPH